MSDILQETQAKPLRLESLRRYRALFSRYLKPQTSAGGLDGRPAAGWDRRFSWPTHR